MIRYSRHAKAFEGERARRRCPETCRAREGIHLTPGTSGKKCHRLSPACPHEQTVFLLRAQFAGTGYKGAPASTALAHGVVLPAVLPSIRDASAAPEDTAVHREFASSGEGHREGLQWRRFARTRAVEWPRSALHLWRPDTFSTCRIEAPGPPESWGVSTSIRRKTEIPIVRDSHSLLKTATAASAPPGVRA